MKEEEVIYDAEKSLSIIESNVANEDIVPGIVRYNEHSEECLINTVYRTTNEWSIGYMKNIIKDNDNVFCVAASGDQYLNSLLYGASNIDLFDINVLTYYYTILKITAIKELSLIDYLKFMNDKSFLNRKSYDKIRNKLPNDVMKYFDYLYEAARKNNYPDGLYYLFYKQRDCDFYSLCPYLTENNYQLLKKRLNESDFPKFMLGDVVKILPRLKDIYDVMLLSNIVDHSDYFIDEEVGKNGFPHLSDNGVVQLHYLWGEPKKHFLQDYLDLEKFNITSQVFNISDEFGCGKESVLLMRK